ncbi:MAG: heparan-alpha-glucosaminide N-acetyltransferase domain-containing protein [Pyrinomonadaceae bacterium]
MSIQPPESTTGRLISLDVFRGITIAGMILVNNPGTWSAIYPPLEHAEWHGWTPTDFIFPFFVFIVGVSITLALGRRVETAKEIHGSITNDVYWKIFRRAGLIFFLGLFLAAFPFYNPNEGTLINLSTLRIPGVLQRIAVCYLVASLIFLKTNWKTQALIAALLLFAYWALITLIPVPGCAVTTFDDKACNLAAWLDRTVFTVNHIWRQAKVYDPEGILSTLPAISTALAGVLTGHWLRTNRSDFEKVGGLFFAGVCGVMTGYVWNGWFPINKALWTSSYVIFTAGMALCLLAACYWLIDIKGYKKWAQPFLIFGLNALALYFFSGIFERLIEAIRWTNASGEITTLQDWIFNSIFLPLASPINASLGYAICYVLFWLLMMWLLYRKRIFIKV